MNPAKLEEFIPMMRPCRAAVIGDVMLDRYVRGTTDRISPEAPIPVLEIADEYELLGGAANVAMKVAELASSRGSDLISSCLELEITSDPDETPTKGQDRRSEYPGS